MNKLIQTHISGYPRIGEKRELKKATEAYWKGSMSREELEGVGKTLRETNWKKQAEAGIDLLPCNDFSFYDQILDFSILVGNIPPRFAQEKDPLFAMARGSDSRDEHDGFASEMTKWFDTNYHYIVPEFYSTTRFKLSDDKIFREFEEATALGHLAKPVIPGPVTYLSLGKAQDSQNPDFDHFELLPQLLDVYEEILQKLAAQGVEWVQIEEPIFALDLNDTQRDALLESWDRISKAAPQLKIIVASYFGELRENLPLFLSLPAQVFHLDAVRGRDEIARTLETFPEKGILSLGVVDGRNIWRNDYKKSLTLLEKAQNALGNDRLWVSPSCSLQHVPITLAHETKLADDLIDWLAYADEKLLEVTTLNKLLRNTADLRDLEDNQKTIRSRESSTRIHRPEVKERLAHIVPADTCRQSDFPQRRVAQQKKLQLPHFPTTTIGSFPQTAEVRAARAKWKKGELSQEEYENYLEEETRQCVAFQDEIGIHMPVHGEFERNDMVEYFGEQLNGFAFTSHGWVQSYGSRYVKPPIIFGDVSRPAPMTVRWSQFAQSLTKNPMKGMLTGPVTILQWSFVRDDQPRATTTRQIALAIRDEVSDLETAGISAIQIDEPAFREGLPLRRSDWEHYLNWAVEAFRLSASPVKDETQIHTHMCYSEFNDIISSIADLDADVITIETSRSNMELLGAFVDFNYPNEIGPGVYDIHSPRIPSVQNMENLMRKAEAVIPRAQLWVNPDCGLKTRSWPEVRKSLDNMVQTAKVLRNLAPQEQS